MPEFANPGFLWALPAAAIPILIHLLHRRRYRPVQWAAMQHLLEARRRNRRRIRLRHLLLLALRCAAVVAIVLLFSRPLVGGVVGVPGGARGRLFVLLDDSASMAQRTGGASAFARGKDVVERLVRETGDRGRDVTVFTASRAESLLAPRRDAEPEGVLDALDTVAAPLEPAEALARLAAAASEVGAVAPTFAVITDLRAADWGADALNPSARRALEGLQDYGPVRLVDVGADPTGTAGVTDVRSAGRFVYADTSTTFRATVRNDSPEPLEGARLSVGLDGRDLPGAAVPTVPPGERRVVPLNLHVGEAGDHRLEVRLGPGDAFAPDDVRRHVFRAADEVPVLILEGRPGAADFLRAALRPEEGTGLRPDVRPASRGLPDRLGDYGALFLCDLRRPPTRREVLTEWIADGGRLVVFAGPETDAQAWDFLPVTVGQVVRTAVGSPVRLLQLDFSDPLLAPFEGWEALFGDARFTGYRRLQAESGTRILARFSDPDATPALVARREGEGVVVVFGTKVDDVWHNWPRAEAGRISYVALMLWLVEHGAPPGPARDIPAGQRLTWSLDAARVRPRATLLSPGPDGAEPSPTTILGERPAESPSVEFLSPRLRQAGFGRVDLTTVDGREQSMHFAVNLPDRERRLERTSRDVVASASVGGRLSVSGYEPSEEPDEARPGAWRLLGWLLLGLLILESVAAWRFGNPPGALNPGERGGR
ncbi:MAG: BatA domain-containing protein [Candidatus Brocadiia bacterium]